MIQENDYSLLKELCNSIGISGYENELTAKLMSILRKVSKADMHIDPIGNLVCISRGQNGNKRIMVTAHIDEVGFQVIKKSVLGYKIKPLGSIKTFDAVSAKVTSDRMNGVIICENESKLSSYSYDLLDLHLNAGQVDTGDIFTFEPNYKEDKEYFISKALDNRIGCFCLLKFLISNVPHFADIYCVFTVQEEVGMRGARVARTIIKPDAILNIDVTPVLDMNSVSINHGVGIKVSDGAVIADPDGVQELVKVAQHIGIPYQLEVNDYGGNEMIITNEDDNGCQLLGLSIPCEKMHSAKSKVGKIDVEACISLLTEYIKEKL